MLQRGDIVVERLTGKRAIVIHVLSHEEVTCRFGDGRFEDRFAFEMEIEPKSLLGFLLSLLLSAFVGSGTRERPVETVVERARPRLARQPGSA
jgi:hypothetical protein